MSIELIERFLAHEELFASREAVVTELESIVTAFGFDYYSVGRQPKPHEMPTDIMLASRWPQDWAQVYVEKKYLVIDPATRFLGQAKRGFRWRDALAAFRDDPQRRRMDRMMADAADHGLKDGYVFPVHGRRGLMGNLTLAGSRVELLPREMVLFDSLAKAVFWRLLEFSDPATVRRLTSDSDVQMTRREMEALSYLADGMTSNEIAKVLEITSNTVDWYMNGIQDKLKARNRHHAVSIAFRLGLIS